MKSQWYSQHAHPKELDVADNRNADGPRRRSRGADLPINAEPDVDLNTITDLRLMQAFQCA